MISTYWKNIVNSAMYSNKEKSAKAFCEYSFSLLYKSHVFYINTVLLLFDKINMVMVDAVFIIFKFLYCS